MQKKVKKIYNEIRQLSIQSFNKRYPSWISNSLTTIEFELEKTLKEIEKLEDLKKEISKLNLIRL